MIYKAVFYNQTGQYERGIKHSMITELFTDYKADDNPIGYADKLGIKYYDRIWFELSEYNPLSKKFEMFFCGMNF